MINHIVQFIIKKINFIELIAKNQFVKIAEKINYIFDN